MKTKVINLYSFDELSEEAKQKAIQNLSDINVNYEWWDFIYEDAERIGLKITGFDTDRYCNGELTEDMQEVCLRITKEHGEQCDTYKLAKDYLFQWDRLVERYSDGKDKDRVAEGNEFEFDGEADDLQEEFLKALLEDYRILLRNEYEHLTGDEAIIETIKANEYTFTEDGKLEN